jgi:hypothetical protein
VNIHDLVVIVMGAGYTLLVSAIPKKEARQLIDGVQAGSG